jgi:signal transduction histidine kinase
MNEVSCKVFGIFAGPLKAKGVPLETMVAGTTVPLDKLRNRKERIDWTDFVQIMKNMRPHFTDDEYVEIGRKYMHQPGLRFGFVIARMLFEPMDFYRWMNTPREGLGNQMFNCIIPSQRELAANKLEIDLKVAEGYEVIWDFFLVSAGNVEELPRLCGLPRAEVKLTPIPRGGRFHVTVATRTPILMRIWRFLTWPFVARTAAKELKAAHDDLRDRYEELESARATLDYQATRLRTAHTVGDLIQGDLDLARTAQSITTALVEQAKFAWAELRVEKSDVAAQFGEPNSEIRLERVLTTQTGPIGTIVVCPQPGADSAERTELLSFVGPTLAMAMQNALAYRELSDYKTGLEKLVDQRTLELREAQEARERFFSNISHEIRTPLSLILLSVADIERRAGQLLDDRSRSGLGSITDASRKLVRLVDELLLLAAGQADKLVIAPEPTDLNGLVEQLGAAWRPAAEAAGLELQTKTPASRTFANVDPVAFERIASNLVSNAVKYTPRGGTVAVELVVDDTVRLSILDTGPGIDTDLAERLFGRFERASGHDRRKAGTGIGLALVKQLVEAHGGLVAVNPRPTGGSEFRVTLPLSRLVDAKPALVTNGAALRTTHAPTHLEGTIASGTVFKPPGLSAGTIVIAEDEPRLAESIASLLSEQYTVIVALDGAAALEQVKQHQPQLLITDVDMPGMNGIELAKRFRESTGDRLAPIIILSAVIDLNTRLAGLEAGAVDYIGKPFDPQELRARVASQFRMRDLAMRLHRAEQLSSMAILTSGLAHELRNPANGIVNAIAPLQMLLPEDIAGPETDVGQLLDAMKSCADQIAFLVRQLLGFRNNVDLELRPCDLPQLVQRAVGLAKDALQAVDVRIDMKVDRRVLCAQPLLVQVLANLIENAGHAAKRGGWVAIRGRSVGTRITLEVSDSGPGVAPELRERVFEPFFTTKAPGQGTGLGLSVARAIIHRHNGTLEISDREGRTAFVIDLPAETVFAQPANAL